jgi:hypothetical protein
MNTRCRQRHLAVLAILLIGRPIVALGIGTRTQIRILHVFFLIKSVDPVYSESVDVGKARAIIMCRVFRVLDDDMETV